MIFALIVVLAILVSVALVGHQLEKAPEGFEDHRGFHFITRSDSAEPTAGIRPASVGLVRPKQHPAASLS